MPLEGAAAGRRQDPAGGRSSDPGAGAAAVRSDPPGPQSGRRTGPAGCQPEGRAVWSGVNRDWRRKNNSTNYIYVTPMTYE